MSEALNIRCMFQPLQKADLLSLYYINVIGVFGKMNSHQNFHTFLDENGYN